MIPAYRDGVWLSHREISGGVSVFFRTTGQPDVVIDCAYPSVSKITVLSQALNSNRLGVLTVRVFSEGSRNSGGLLFVNGNDRTNRLIVTEPYLLQRAIVDERGLIWALATIRDSTGKHVEDDHPALVTIDPRTGERTDLLKKRQLPHAAKGAHWTWGAARTHVSGGLFTAFFPTENRVILLDSQGRLRTVAGPPDLGSESYAVAVLRCEQNVFISVQRDLRREMFRLDLATEKWHAVTWKGHPSFTTAAPRLIACGAEASLEVAFGAKSVGTLSPLK